MEKIWAVSRFCLNDDARMNIYPSLDIAIEAAELQANNNPGKEYYIFESISTVTARTIITHEKCNQ